MMQPCAGATTNARPGATSLAGFLAGWLLLFLALPGTAAVVTTTAKQRALAEWKNLTGPNAEVPRVFVKGNHIRFYFQSPTNVVRFSAGWEHLRVPTDGYAVSEAKLHLDKTLKGPPGPKDGWREVAVIAGAAWQRFSTNLTEALTPPTPWHGAFFQALQSDRVLYRDGEGVAHTTSLGDQPAKVIIDHRYPLEETLQILAAQAEKYRAERHPDESVFLLMPPNSGRVSQLLLVDRQRHQAVSLL